MPTDYDATHEALRDILTPFSPSQVKEANKAVKAAFGKRYSFVRPDGSCQYTYGILCEEDGDWELDYFKWDFFDRQFA